MGGGFGGRDGVRCVRKLEAGTIAGRVTRPEASSLNARNTMRANRAESQREILFRKALWQLGIRGYRVHPKLPGNPDLTFPRLQLAIFVHGCFWHRCPECKLPVPKANREFWTEKFIQNRRRDQLSASLLASQGFETMIVWEHEIRPDPFPRAATAAKAIAERRMAWIHPSGSSAS